MDLISEATPKSGILALMLMLFGIGMVTQPASAQRYELVWSDEFDGEELDRQTWERWYGTAFNQELQFYTRRDTNSYVQDGLLHIVGLRESFNGREWTSARMKSQYSADFLYGKFEMRAKLPEGRGLWPAFWMMPSDAEYGGWPYSGEMDIMENRGHEPQNVQGTIHFSRVAVENSTDPLSDRVFTGDEFTLETGSFFDSYHLFQFEWTDSTLTWSIDDIPYHTIRRSEVEAQAEVYPFNKRFYFILNLAIGGNYLGDAQPDETTPDRNVLLIDYVRAYQDANQPPVITTTYGDSLQVEPLTPTTLTADVSDPDGGTVERVEFLIDGELQGTDTTAPFEYEWSATIEGCQELEIRAQDNENGVGISDTTTLVVGSGCSQAPFNDRPHQLPGTIQLEQYDVGGAGVSYFETTPDSNLGNLQGNDFRTTEAVDIFPDPNDDANYIIGEAEAGEWTRYTVEVETSGIYDITFQALPDGGNGRVDFQLDDENWLSFIRLRGSGDTPIMKTQEDVPLNAGVYDLKMETVITGARPDLLSATLIRQTSIDGDSGPDLPQQPQLHQNFPNPFNPSTTISFTLPQPQQVTLSVFNSVGQQVATLIDGVRTSGFHSLSFDASSLSSGIYFYRLQTPNAVETRQMILIK